jgi:hypothetical protein
MQRVGLVRVVAMSCVMGAGVSAATGQGGFSDLDAAQQRTVREGGQVVVARDVKGLPWPELTIYQTVNATPEEAAAVFFDYNHARAFIPNLLKSEIARVHSPCSVEVDYGVKVPVLPDEFYTAQNDLASPGPGVYAVTWKLLRAVQTKNSTGEFRVGPFGRGSLIRYRNLTVPGSAMAGLLKGQATRQMKQTVAAIVAEIERQKRESPEALASRVRALKQAVAGEGGRPKN